MIQVTFSLLTLELKKILFQVQHTWSCEYDVNHLLYVSLEHKSSHTQHSYICRNRQQYIVWVKIIIFILGQKSLDIKIMFH